MSVRTDIHFWFWHRLNYWLVVGTRLKSPAGQRGSTAHTPRGVTLSISNVHDQWCYECSVYVYRQNAFERGIMLPDHAAVSLASTKAWRQSSHCCTHWAAFDTDLLRHAPTPPLWDLTSVRPPQPAFHMATATRPLCIIFGKREQRAQPTNQVMLFIRTTPPWSFLIVNPTRCTNFSNLFWKWNSTCFGQFLCPGGRNCL
jgi:hypothetical protein